MAAHGTTCRRLLLLSLIPVMTSLVGYDDVHWFRPYFFFGEPRLEKARLGEIKGYGAYGSSYKGKSCSKTTVPLLDIYGTHNIHEAAAQVPFAEPLTHDDIILKNLLATTGGPCYAHLSCSGKFSLTELEAVITQNISHGLFLECTIPARELRISDIVRHDLTPPDEQTPEWQAFLEQGQAIFSNYNLSIADYVRSGVGDIALSFGWTGNYEDFSFLDFFDISIQAGVVFPTSNQILPRYFLDIPIGFNGHSGYFGIIDGACGLYDWLTFGAHFQAIGFTTHQEVQHIKTARAQEGLFLIEPASINSSWGPAFTAGIYGKADHVLLGLSVLLGYSFVHKNADCWQLCASQKPYAFTDQRRMSWDMHILHLIIDYDYATYHNPYAPKIGFVYNRSLQGRRIFPLSLFGGLWSMTFEWAF